MPTDEAIRVFTEGVNILRSFAPAQLPDRERAKAIRDLEADPERYCNANLSPINDLSVSVAGL